MAQAQVDSFTERKAAPPFKVRDYDLINENIGFSPLPNDFVSEPIWVRMGYDTHDDIRTHGCHFVKADNRDRVKKHDLWSPYMVMKDSTSKGFMEAFGFTPQRIHKMSFLEYCTHADTLVAADYEGSLSYQDYFTEEQWAYVKSF